MSFRRSNADKTFDAILYFIVGLYSIMAIYPFYNVLVMSFNNGQDLFNGPIYFWPRKFDLLNYNTIFTNPVTLNAYFMSISRTLIGVAVTIFNTSMAAFALRKRDIAFRPFYLMVFTIPMFFGGGLIPSFINYKNLGIYNTFFIYIIPYAFNYFFCIILMSFFSSIGDSLEESARIEGAGNFAIFTRIYLPCSLPVLAALILFEGVNQWNMFFDTLYFTVNDKLMTMQALLVKIITQSEITTSLKDNFDSDEFRSATPEGLKLAAMMAATLPIVCIYPFLQKYFIKGIMIGAIKE